MKKRPIGFLLNALGGVLASEGAAFINAKAENQKAPPRSAPPPENELPSRPMTIEPSDRDAAEQISIFNFCGVSAKEGRVVQLISHGGSLDPEDAIRFAAWLIVAAELAGYERAPQHAAALVERIQKT